MLEIARSKQIYQNLHQLYLDTDIELPESSYGAIIAAGVLTHGHAPHEALDGMLKLLRFGGVIIFSLSEIAYTDFGFDKKMEELEAQNKWILRDRSTLFRTYPFSEKEAHLRHWVYVFEKT
jgi:SAM-dependent methyltransferase